TRSRRWAWTTSKRCRSPRSACGRSFRAPRALGKYQESDMYPAAFDYHAPGSIKEALDLLGKHKDDAKLLAGGHSLIPMMKLRLAQPKHLIDLRKVPGLTGIKQDGNVLAIGAMTTHWEVESSSVVKSKLAVLSEVAALIGDPAVRNRGT